MSEITDGFPQLRHPPIQELALSVQFTGPRELASWRLGHFVHGLRTEFPSVEEHPELDPMHDLGPSHGQRLGFEIFTTPPSPRFWLVDEGRHRLLQLQRNRIGFNWRREPGQPTYPRYPAVVADLKKYVGQFLRFVEGEGLESPQPTHCEVLYLDHVTPGQQSRFAKIAQLDRVLRLWSPETQAMGVEQPDEAGCFVRYDIGAGPGRSAGQVQLEALPARRAGNDQAVLIIQTVVRCQLRPNTWQSAWDVLEEAHGQAVSCFFRIVREEMLQEWGIEG